ncbi:MAG: hypothetical protein JOY80_08780 [Candidatus Dormibacteraeota bacterium]|nr:hypothetical protein [Candidatus Dormibacteraeota bacterium]
MQRNDDGLEETLKPDIPHPTGRKLSPEEALREARDTYGDSSTSPNREDQEDMHRGAED